MSTSATERALAGESKMRNEDFPSTEGLTKRTMVDAIMRKAHGCSDPAMVRYYMSWKRDQLCQQYRNYPA